MFQLGKRFNLDIIYKLGTSVMLYTIVYFKKRRFEDKTFWVGGWLKYCPITLPSKFFTFKFNLLTL